MAIAMITIMKCNAVGARRRCYLFPFLLPLSRKWRHSSSSSKPAIDRLGLVLIVGPSYSLGGYVWRFLNVTLYTSGAQPLHHSDSVINFDKRYPYTFPYLLGYLQYRTLQQCAIWQLKQCRTRWLGDKYADFNKTKLAFMVFLKKTKVKRVTGLRYCV